MKGQTDNLHAARWTDDPDQRKEFLTEVGPKIDRESKNMAGRYRVGMHHEDIASEIRLKYLQQMEEGDTDGPFAKDSPKEAAAVLLEEENYQIRERARPLARKEFKRQSSQAEILANVRQPDVSPDKQTELLDAAEGIRRASSEIPGFTPRERDIFCKEMLRQMGIDDLPAASFDQAAQAAGASGFEMRAYLEYHDEHGHLSPRDRKAWSRARAKVVKALTRAALTWLLAIVFALSLALLDAIQQGRSINQNDFVNQGRSSDEIANTHQGKSDEVALTHQGKSDEIALAHQGFLIDEVAFAHQGYLAQEALDA